MVSSFILFSTLASRLFQEEHPPAEEMTTFLSFGLSPVAMVTVVLLVIAILWVALNAQAGRADLHAVADHGGHHGSEHHTDAHHDTGHEH